MTPEKKTNNNKKIRLKFVQGNLRNSGVVMLKSVYNAPKSSLNPISCFLSYELTFFFCFFAHSLLLSSHFSSSSPSLDVT